MLSIILVLVILIKCSYCCCFVVRVGLMIDYRVIILKFIKYLNIYFSEYLGNKWYGFLFKYDWY